MNTYDLSRCFWNYAFENPDKIKPNHSAIYFFAIEHCNRLGWKEKFGFPTVMVMEAVGIKSYNTYLKGLTDLVDFGFIKMIEKSKNQYSANIIALSKFDKAQDKPLDKAFIKHGTKQSESTGQSTGQSIVSIDKPIYNNTNIQTNKALPSFDDFKTHAISKKPLINIEDLERKYDNWVELGWVDGNGNPIKNWKIKLNNTLPYLKFDPEPEQLFWVSSRGNPKVKMNKARMDKYIKTDGSQLMDLKTIEIK